MFSAKNPKSCGKAEKPFNKGKPLRPARTHAGY
jgi:hypothetical protein